MKKLLILLFVLLSLTFSVSAEDIYYNNTTIPDFGKIYNIECDRQRTNDKTYYYHIQQSYDYLLEEYLTLLEKEGFSLLKYNKNSKTYTKPDGSFITIRPFKQSGEFSATPTEQEYLVKISAYYDWEYDTIEEKLCYNSGNDNEYINLNIGKKEIYFSDIIELIADKDVFWSVSDTSLIKIKPSSNKLVIIPQKTGRVKITATNLKGAKTECVLKIQEDLQDEIKKKSRRELTEYITSDGRVFYKKDVKYKKITVYVPYIE